MSDSGETARAGASKMVWVGRGITVLMVGTFLFSAVMKLMGGEELEQEIARLGLPLSMVVLLAILEIVCAIIYLIPMTSVIGAILLTGYMGGAICTHWRIGDPFYSQIAIGVLVWLGLFLRDERLRSLMPWRR